MPVSPPKAKDIIKDSTGGVIVDVTTAVSHPLNKEDKVYKTKKDRFVKVKLTRSRLDVQPNDPQQSVMFVAVSAALADGTGKAKKKKNFVERPDGVVYPSDHEYIGTIRRHTIQTDMPVNLAAQLEAVRLDVIEEVERAIDLREQTDELLGDLPER